MIEYQSLLGRQFELGVNDCYSLIREFYKNNFNIDLPDYARPAGFWEHGMNLYMDRYFKHGFEPLDVHPSMYQPGDVVIMSVVQSIPGHAGILVENGKLLHHYTNRLSEVVSYKRVWRNSTVVVLRHKDVTVDVTTTTADLLDYVYPSKKREIDAALSSRSSSEKV